MPIVPQVFNGMEGKRDADTLRNLPVAGFTNNGVQNPIIRLNYEKTTRLENPSANDIGVLKSMNGGGRGVMPCKGNANIGSLSGAVRVMRRPAIPYEGGIYPRTGFARNQPKGLVYDPQKPINNPLMPLADSFNAGLNSRIPQPA